MRRIVVWGLCGLGFFAVACTTPGVENELSSASALEEDSASEVTGDDDSCSNVDGDSGSGGPTVDGSSSVDGDSGSGGPTVDGSSSVDGDSGSGGDFNLAGITPKPKPKPKPACVCAAPNAAATSASACPKTRTETRTDTVQCVSTGTQPGNFSNGDGNWFCHAGDGITSASPHSRCEPSVGSPNATHTHRYEVRYNFAPAKRCCFHDKVEIGCTCADGSRC